MKRNAFCGDPKNEPKRTQFYPPMAGLPATPFGGFVSPTCLGVALAETEAFGEGGRTQFQILLDKGKLFDPVV